jgi:hypothetical protein
MKQDEESKPEIPAPKTTAMNKIFKIEISDKVYIAAAMQSGRVFYTVSVTFNGREQALLYCLKHDVFFLYMHGGQDFKDNTQIRFLCEDPILDVPSKIKRLFKHVDENECIITQVHEDLYYTIKPSVPFEPKEDEK